MPQIRYFTVDVHVRAKVSGVSDGGGELTHSEAMNQILQALQSTPALRHGIQIDSATVTETDLGGSPITPSPIRLRGGSGEARKALGMPEENGEQQS